MWRYSCADFDLGCELLDSIDWDSLLDSDDIDSNWEAWLSKFLEIMETCIPTVTVHTSRNLPWLTKSILQAIRKRNSLFRIHKKTQSPSDQQKFRAARYKVTAMLRQSKSAFFAELAYSSQKQFWKAVKFINRTDCSIPTLHDRSK